MLYITKMDLRFCSSNKHEVTQSVTAVASGSYYYGRTGFQMSATGGTAYFVFNDAGQLAMDSSREIMDMTYNRQGLPVQVSFVDGSNVIYTYSYAGELRSMKFYYKSKLTTKREYCGDFILENDTLSMVNFPGGYFDSEGKPNYRHTDWQGNVTMVTNSEGKIAQHTGYYPYGEPWSEPAGQPYLFGGKERLREGALNEYDFGARRYNSALALWTTPDPMARDYSPYCPYIHCGSNPIRFKELDGCDWVERTVDGINEFYYDRTVSCAADVDRIYGSKSGVSYVSDGQSVNLGGNTFTFHNEPGTVDKDGIGQDNSEIIYGEDYTIFGTTDNSCNAATLHKNWLKGQIAG